MKLALEAVVLYLGYADSYFLFVFITANIRLDNFLAILIIAS